MPTVRAGTAADADAIVSVITLAFSGDPVARWAIPDPYAYVRAMPSVVRAFGERAFESASAYHVEGFSGAALWLAPGAEPDGERLVALFQEHGPKETMSDLLGFFEQMSLRHPTEPHWYLPLIGVDPSRQAQGLGGALMRHALERCDRDHLPAYLESSNPRNISLYLRHGFEVLPVIQVGSSPRLTPMYRKAR